MLWRKIPGYRKYILPCAGITLIRFTGLISDPGTGQEHPGNTENLQSFLLERVRTTTKVRRKFNFGRL